ncbi:MAG: hypothetical protein IPK82_23350 [Polyangiaceae bacterium]|nr:hypothetical protein [Polyangiaceae bacterium]
MTKKARPKQQPFIVSNDDGQTKNTESQRTYKKSCDSRVTSGGVDAAPITERGHTLEGGAKNDPLNTNRDALAPSVVVEVEVKALVGMGATVADLERLNLGPFDLTLRLSVKDFERLAADIPALRELGKVMGWLPPRFTRAWIASHTPAEAITGLREQYGKIALQLGDLAHLVGKLYLSRATTVAVPQKLRFDLRRCHAVLRVSFLTAEAFASAFGDSLISSRLAADRDTAFYGAERTIIDLATYYRERAESEQWCVDLAGRFGVACTSQRACCPDCAHETSARCASCGLWRTV